MVMNENISRLMDGEIDATELNAVCTTLRNDTAMATWNCYHVIGDALRGESPVTRNIASTISRRLADEPAIIARRAASPSGPAAWAWAAAASLAAMTVVGWTAYSMVDAAPAGFAKAREAGTMSAAQMRPVTVLPADYLLAHQEYAPANALQGVGPYLRDVAASTPVRAPAPQ
jgi:sigma-E factor negative regulatory protein RseA